MKRLLAIVLSLGMLGILAAPVAAARPGANAVDIPITGTAPGGTTFEGVFELTRFATQGGDLVAVGTLTGTLTDALGNVIGTVTDLPLRLPVDLATAQATCDILHLELGPLDLDLLGLQVHLDQVVLDITAVPGPGNLLGNLLCAVAGLLDGGLNLNSLAQLLNQILSILG